MATPVLLEAVRTRREALYEAIVGLEDALATPIGDGTKWRLRVAMAVEHAAARVAQHAGETEAPGGFFDRLVQTEPRLGRRVDQMKVDHERLAKEVEALRLAVAVVEDAYITDSAEAVRNQALELLGQLTQLRKRGADLIYEAYKVDIGKH